MSELWASSPFEDCLEKVVYPPKIQRKDFLNEGSLPIISQEAEFINGYWNDDSVAFKVASPIVIFGDHTQVLKFVDFNFVLGADGVKILAPKKFLDPKFFYYFLLSNPVGKLGYARHYRLLKSLTVKYPPLPEQRRIVAVLDEAFEGLAIATANTEKNLKNAREIFEGYLKSVFVDQRDNYLQAELGDLCLQVTDGTHNSPSYVSSGIPMLDSKHIDMNFGIDDQSSLKFISKETDKILSARCKPQNGDILISSRGTIGKIAIVGENQNFNIMGNMILLRLPTEVNRYFAAFFLRSQVSYINSIARGVAQKGLYLNQIRSFSIPLPTSKEQEEIGKRLWELSERVGILTELFQNKLAAIAELKQSLLQKAFAGELTKDFRPELEAALA